MSNIANSHNGSNGTSNDLTQPEQGKDETARRGKADLHIHTSLGDGLASVQQIFDFVENYTDLDIIAITDHDDARGAMQALELAERRSYRFKVIPGNEITTR
ncbi:MAG: PHP domain-containing protein, partial [Chloroflexia bacterium]